MSNIICFDYIKMTKRLIEIEEFFNELSEEGATIEWNIKIRKDNNTFNYSGKGGF